MSDYFMSRDMGNGEHIYISPINSEVAVAQNIGINESVGYYLYKRLADSRLSDVCILAKLPSEEAAFELGQILGLA